ncbi:MAG: hypothetical protein IJX26_02370 [Clostridia bacterium]|nr:hypothetical protein [Clostridia bacterium]
MKFENTEVIIHEYNKDKKKLEISLKTKNDSITVYNYFSTKTITNHEGELKTINALTTKIEFLKSNGRVFKTYVMKILSPRKSLHTLTSYNPSGSDSYSYPVGSNEFDDQIDMFFNIPKLYKLDEISSKALNYMLELMQQNSPQIETIPPYIFNLLKNIKATKSTKNV